MATVDHLLVITARHERMATTTVKGRATSVPVVLDPAIRTRKHTPSARDLESADRINARADVVFYFRPTADVRVEDRIVVGGVAYEVTALLPPSLAHHLKAFAKDMQRAPAQPAAP